MGTLIDKVWVQLGGLGLLIILLLLAVAWLAKHNKCIMKEHREERDEWRNESKEQTNKLIDVIERNATTMSELGTLIQRKCR